MTNWIQSSKWRVLLLAAVLTPFAPSQASAQVGIAAEAVSSYVWRGFELDDGVNLQPDVWVDVGNLSFGAWSSWALDGDASEIDFYVSLYQELSFGELNLSLTDYFYPSADGEFDDIGNFDGDGNGAHTLELGVEFTPTAIPVSVMLGWNAHNDPDKALYGQLSTDQTLGDFADLHVESGLLLKDSENYYGGEMGDLTHFGVSLTRYFSLGAIEPYFSAGFVRSQIEDSNYWVFAIGF